jgi:hypothetical protein
MNFLPLKICFFRFLFIDTRFVYLTAIIMTEDPFVSVEIQWDDMNLPLSFSLSATILDVKTQLADVTGIPVEQQSFKNLRYPKYLKVSSSFHSQLYSTSVLASLDLSQPIILESVDPDSPPSDIIEEEEEDFIGVQTNLSTQEQFLTMLDVLRIEDFKSEFESKYESTIHPNFYTGTCQEAVAQSKVQISIHQNLIFLS